MDCSSLMSSGYSFVLFSFHSVSFNPIVSLKIRLCCRTKVMLCFRNLLSRSCIRWPSTLFIPSHPLPLTPFYTSFLLSISIYLPVSTHSSTYLQHQLPNTLSLSFSFSTHDKSTVSPSHSTTHPIDIARKFASNQINTTQSNQPDS